MKDTQKRVEVTTKIGMKHVHEFKAVATSLPELCEILTSAIECFWKLTGQPDRSYLEMEIENAYEKALHIWKGSGISFENIIYSMQRLEEPAADKEA